MMKVKVSVLILALNLANVFSQLFTDCDKEEYVFTPKTFFRSKWYSKSGAYSNEPMSSCRYQAIAPPGYFIRASCTIDFVTDELDAADCEIQRFYISREGDQELADAEYFCGNETVTRDSIDSYMTLAYTSNSFSSAGRFECSVQAIKITQENCDCGWSADSKIVGGVEATTNSYPWIVSLQQGFWSTNHFCGGTLIRVSDTVDESDIIITASHCLAEDPGNLKQGLSTFGGLVTETSSGRQFQVKSIVSDGSIAVIKLATPVRLTRNLAPACLPKNGNLQPTFSGTNIFTSVGLGTPLTLFDPTTPIDWAAATLSPITNAKCARALTGFNITKDHVCAYSNNLLSTFNPTNGSALFQSSGGRDVLVGILSAANQGTLGSPSVFTKVASHLEFIESAIGNGFICRK